LANGSEPRRFNERTFGMSTNLMRKPKRVLEPVVRISEFLFGLIMVLTLTCTFNASGASRAVSALY
jgi:hypothetical protein